MNRITRNIIVDLVISNDHGSPTVTKDDKGPLALYLTHVLVNDVTLQKHKDFLTKELHCVNPPTLAPQIVKNTADNGLDALNNNQLATLALDFNALDSLFKEIETDSHDAWQSALQSERA